MGGTATTPTSSVGYLDLVRRNVNFRNLWLGQVISLFGDWFNLIASAALIGLLTGSGVAIGGLFVIRFLAPFIASPLAGLAADRFNRKHVLIACDLSRIVVVIGFFFVRDPGDIWLLYGLTALQLAIGGIFYTSRTAILPDIVSDRELGTANALTSATWSVMLALGAAVGGLVTGGWGIYQAFAIDALSFVISAFFISRMVYLRPTDRPLDGEIRTNPVRDFIDGLRYLGEHHDILVISLQKAAFHITISGPFTVVQVALASNVFVIGEGGGISLGIILAVTGVGTGIGPIITRRFTGDRDRSLRIALAAGYLIAALGAAVVATLENFGVVLLGNLFRSVGGGIGWVFSTQLLLQLLPGDVRGRVLSTEFAFFTLASAIGAVLGGWALDNEAIGLERSIYWMAIIALIPFALWVLWMIFGERESPAVETETEEPAVLEK
ncbi:MAG: MFS transporter [Anaerolineales bacterium]|nr:MFS transporter [Anaerolineales bacterium]